MSRISHTEGGLPARGGDGKEPIMWKQRKNQSYFRELRFSQATAVYPAAFILKPAEKKYIS